MKIPKFVGLVQHLSRIGNLFSAVGAQCELSRNKLLLCLIEGRPIVIWHFTLPLSANLSAASDNLILFGLFSPHAVRTSAFILLQNVPGLDARSDAVLANQCRFCCCFWSCVLKAHALLIEICLVLSCLKLSCLKLSCLDPVLRRFTFAQNN